MCSLVVVAVCEACELKKPGLLFGGCELTVASTSCH